MCSGNYKQLNKCGSGHVCVSREQGGWKGAGPRKSLVGQRLGADLSPEEPVEGLAGIGVKAGWRGAGRGEEPSLPSGVEV